MPTLRGRRPPNAAAAGMSTLAVRRFASTRSAITVSRSACLCACRRCSCRSRTPDLPAVARTAFASEPGLRGSARNDPVPMSSRWAGISDATTGDPARSASITGRDSPSSKEGTTTTLASARRASISSSLIRSRRPCLAGTHRRGDRPVVHAVARARHPDHDHVAGLVAGRRSRDAGEPAEGVLAGIVTGHHHDRTGRRPCRSRCASGQHIARPCHVGHQGVRADGWPAEQRAELRLHHVRDAHELVVEPKGVQCRRVLGTGRDVAQVDRGVVLRDEVEDHGQLGGGAVQDRHQRLRARRHRRGLHEHPVGRQLALVDPGDLAAVSLPAPRGAPPALGRPGGRAGRRPRHRVLTRARLGRTGRCPGCRTPPSAGSGRRTGRGLPRPTRDSSAPPRARGADGGLRAHGRAHRRGCPCAARACHPSRAGRRASRERSRHRRT